MTAKGFCRLGQLILALAGLTLVFVPLGVSFTGYFLLAVLAAWSLGLFLRHRADGSRGWRICYGLFLAGLGLGAVCLVSIEAVLISHGEADNSDLPVDAVIVLGAGVNGETPSAALQSRIDAAAAYLQKHPGVPAVLSGGQGPGERITEAEAMRRCLEGRVDNPLLLEDRSTSTAENFRFSKALLEERGLDTGSVAVVTNDFHCFRSHMIAQKQGLNIIDVPAELPWWWLTANYYLREAFALVKTALLD